MVLFGILRFFGPEEYHKFVFGFSQKNAPLVAPYMARISYQNSTFCSFCKFDIHLLNWTFVLFISTFVSFASAFVFQGGHSFYINSIRL